MISSIKISFVSVNLSNDRKDIENHYLIVTVLRLVDIVISKGSIPAAIVGLV